MELKHTANRKLCQKNFKTDNTVVSTVISHSRGKIQKSNILHLRIQR